jgi:DeoR/GlpR family transcriptional regulator of sugar metabolism
MKRDLDIKERRAVYVAEVVEQYNNKPAAYKKLSEELFLSERTIRNDLAVASKIMKPRSRM